ncbi:MAG TPA: MCE family protein [Acidimicrobiales bacterium]|nr:MCE family protein [Acidimicrobiales bacterium]
MKGTIIKLAVFVTVGVVITAGLAMAIGNIHPFRHTYSVSATFDDVTGLLPDDNVKVAGVSVGKVQGIRVEHGRAVVKMSIDQNVRVPRDSEAVIRWRNLLGQRYVYVVPGTAATVLRSGDRIAKTRSVVDLGELFNRLGPIVQAIDPSKVNEFLDAVVAALDGNEVKLRQAVDDLATLTSALAQRDQAIGRMIQNLDTVAGTITSRDREIRSVLDNLLSLAQTFHDNTDVLNQAITDLGGVSHNMSILLANNRAEIDRIIANLNTLLAVVKQKLPQLDDTLNHLDEGAAALFRSASYGEFLNQEILCIRVAAAGVETPCGAGVAKPGSNGRKAIVELMAGASG